MSELTAISKGEPFDLRGLRGPFDIIGDVHGCATELELLLAKLGYSVTHKSDVYQVTPPEGRKVIFLGDLTDRGPRAPDCLRLVASMVRAGDALCVRGNHDYKLMQLLRGDKVNLSHGRGLTVAQLDAEPEEFKEEVLSFLQTLVTHYVLDEGRLVVAHAGLIEELHYKYTGKAKSFAMFGKSTGATDEYGLPIREDWAQGYVGDALIVYGHTPVLKPRWVHNTVCLDTACVFGGQLTALRYPEKEIVAVDALEEYYALTKPVTMDI